MPKPPTYTARGIANALAAGTGALYVPGYAPARLAALAEQIHDMRSALAASLAAQEDGLAPTIPGTARRLKVLIALDDAVSDARLPQPPAPPVAPGVAAPGPAPLAGPGYVVPLATCGGCGATLAPGVYVCPVCDNNRAPNSPAREDVQPTEL